MGISAREAGRFVRQLHRNSIFQSFKGGKEREKTNWKTLAVWWCKWKNVVVSQFNSLYDNVLYICYFKYIFKYSVIYLLCYRNRSFIWAKSHQHACSNDSEHTLVLKEILSLERNEKLIGKECGRASFGSTGPKQLKVLADSCCQSELQLGKL